MGSAGNERQITNVAGGTAPTDAVNVRQLDAGIAQANLYTDTQIANLGLNIDSVRKDANAGSASAISVASMPQSTMPGKSMAAAGVGYYDGPSAKSIREQSHEAIQRVRQGRAPHLDGGTAWLHDVGQPHFR